MNNTEFFSFSYITISFLTSFSMNLISLSQFHVSLHEFNIDHILEQLKDLSTSAKLDQMMLIFQYMGESSQILENNIITAWQYVIEHQLWKSRFTTLKEFQNIISFDILIEPFLSSKNNNAKRMKTEATAIYRRWDRYTSFFLSVRSSFRSPVVVLSRSDC
jgi:predicted chitinase